jgi:bifunctional NMN adenylyltransferase/nudix hydrolase
VSGPRRYGVIIGRFQVPDLHDGHDQLVSTVAERCDHLIVVFGRSPLPLTERDPLTVEQREWLMEPIIEPLLRTSLDGYSWTSVQDHPNDAHWSQEVDRAVLELVNDTADGRPYEVTLYGSRDSFIPYYSGKFPTVELPEHPDRPSGEAVRTEIRSRGMVGTDSPQSFAEGVIWASAQPFPTVYSTVDAVIVHPHQPATLLGRKPGMNKWCFIGGFTDPSSTNDEEDLVREVAEETGIRSFVSRPDYVGDYTVDDERYKRTPHTVRTRLYLVFPSPLAIPVAGDDIEEVRWFEAKDVRRALAPNHVPLWDKACAHLVTNYVGWEHPL